MEGAVSLVRQAHAFQALPHMQTLVQALVSILLLSLFMVVLRGGPTLPILQRWQQAPRAKGHDQAMDDNMYEPVSQCQAPNPDSPAWGQSPAWKGPSKSLAAAAQAAWLWSWGIFRRTRGSGLPQKRLTLPPPVLPLLQRLG